jgi:hypothetical protein
VPTDAERDRLAAALARGRARLERLRDHPDEVRAVAATLAWDGWRTRAVRWSIEHDPDAVGQMVLLTDLVRLGADGEPLPDAWGVSALPTHACACLRFPGPEPLSTMIGRPGIGLMATRFADLPILAAEILAGMRLPASLARGLLMLLTQSALDHAQPGHPDDLLSLSGVVRQLSRAQFEDFVASLTYDGPLRRLRSTASPQGGPRP